MAHTSYHHDLAQRIRRGLERIPVDMTKLYPVRILVYGYRRLYMSSLYIHVLYPKEATGIFLIGQRINMVL